LISALFQLAYFNQCRTFASKGCVIIDRLTFTYPQRTVGLDWNNHQTRAYANVQEQMVLPNKAGCFCDPRM